MMDHIVSFTDRPRITLRHTKRRVAIMVAMATGWLPWGIEWKARLPLCMASPGPMGMGRERPGYILCCGHVLREAEAQKFVDAGLLKAGISTEQDGRPHLVIGDEGVRWLVAYFS